MIQKHFAAARLKYFSVCIIYIMSKDSSDFLIVLSPSLEEEIQQVNGSDMSENTIIYIQIQIKNPYFCSCHINFSVFFPFVEVFLFLWLFTEVIVKTLSLAPSWCSKYVLRGLNVLKFGKAYRDQLILY